MTDRITRRALAAGAALFASLGLGAARRPVEDALLAVLSDRHGARLVGHMSLEAWPDMRDRLRLRDTVLADLGIGYAEAAKVSADVMRSKMAQRVQDDFAQGRTVKLDGWLMALTEARLCALAALT